MKILFSLFISLSLFLNSCGSNSKSDNNTQVFSLQEKEFVHNLFLTEYLWYEQVSSNIDYSSFSTPQSLINELRITPPDKWSFSMTKDEYEDLVNQKTSGFGFEYTKNLRVFLVSIGAPAYGKLLRGDIILEINGETASSSNLTKAKNAIGTPTKFTLLRGSDEVTVDITPQPYTFKVSLGKIITQDNKKIGYLRYDLFTGTSVAEFEDEFTKFKNENIDELVIDLRYNGGGSVAVASLLLDNISNTQPGERQGYLDWNANYQNNNENYYFSDDVEANDLNMKRVIFLVTKNSASASELVISALTPYLGKSNVVTIGTNTHGKNVGMTGKTYGRNFYFIINFYVRNNLGETTSFEGIPPTCTANDDMTRILGDRNETMLSTALYYIQNNSCP